MNHLMKPAQIVFITIIFLTAAGLRFYALNADPPLQISVSQGATTDASNTVGPARDKLLFGSWTKGFFSKRMYNDYPAVIWLAYAFFSLLGPGYWQASLMTVMLSLISMAFYYAFAKENLNNKVALITLVFLTFNYIFLIYNRMSVVYTPLNLLIAISMYCWGRGLKKPVWFLFSLFIAACNVLFVKLAGIAFLTTVIFSTGIWWWRNNRQKQAMINAFVGAAILGILLLLAILFIPSPKEWLLRSIQMIGKRTLNPSNGLQDNLRFVIWGVLYFGIRTIFFVRMPILFLLSYTYILKLVASILLEPKKKIPITEVLLLFYMGTTIVMLLFTNGLSTRYMILLIPPMALSASLTLDAFMRFSSRQIPQLSKLNLPYLLFLYLGLSYLVYILTVISFQYWQAQHLDFGFADSQAIVEPATLLLLFIVALLAGLVGIFVYLIFSLRGPNELPLSYQARNIIPKVLVFAIISIGFSQYLSWAIKPEYTIVAASNQFGEDFHMGEVVLGGPYAYVLTSENDLRAHIFFPHTTSLEAVEDVESSDMTHLAVETAWNEDYMRKNFSEVMSRAIYVKSYYVRGYQVNVYEVTSNNDK